MYTTHLRLQQDCLHLLLTPPLLGPRRPWRSEFAHNPKVDKTGGSQHDDHESVQSVGERQRSVPIDQAVRRVTDALGSDEFPVERRAACPEDVEDRKGGLEHLQQSVPSWWE